MSIGRRAEEKKKNRNKLAAAALRKEREERMQKHLWKETDAGSGPYVLSDEEKEQASAMLNLRMKEVITDPLARSWFKLFNWIDNDGSGKIDYHEMEEMIRKDLKVSLGKMPEHQLQALWRTLDEDRSGLISIGEFGNFMRLGAHVLGAREPWKVRRHKAKTAEGAAVRSDLRMLLSNRRLENAQQENERRERALEQHAWLWGLSEPASEKPSWRSPRARNF